jgi:hypothetical protein
LDMFTIGSQDLFILPADSIFLSDLSFVTKKRLQYYYYFFCQCLLPLFQQTNQSCFTALDLLIFAVYRQSQGDHRTYIFFIFVRFCDSCSNRCPGEWFT